MKIDSNHLHIKPWAIFSRYNLGTKGHDDANMFLTSLKLISAFYASEGSSGGTVNTLSM